MYCSWLWELFNNLLLRIALSISKNFFNVHIIDFLKSPGQLSYRVSCILSLTFLMMSFNWTSICCTFRKLQVRFRALIIFRINIIIIFFFGKKITYILLNTSYYNLSQCLVTGCPNIKIAKFSFFRGRQQPQTLFIIKARFPVTVTSSLWDGTWVPCNSCNCIAFYSLSTDDLKNI